MLKNATLVALMLLGCGHLNKINDGALLATETTLAIDWHQTNWMTEHATHYHEGNSILGTHPTNVTVAAYFSGWMLGALATHYALPRWVQPIAYGVITGVELATIRDNLAVGTGW